MNTLWTFGDSYIQAKPMDSESSWVKLIAHELGLESKAFGKNATSLEYMYKCVDDNLRNFKENDIVIITLTNHFRRWIIAERPEFSWLPIIEILAEYKHNIDFYKQYFATLDIGIITRELKFFLFYLESQTRHMKIKPIVFNCFKTMPSLQRNMFQNTVAPFVPDLNFVSYYLNGISDSELVPAIQNIKTQTKKEWIVYKDNRINHMSIYNNNVLKNKIVKFIQDGTPIRLHEGFAKCIIDAEIDTVSDKDKIICLSTRELI